MPKKYILVRWIDEENLSVLPVSAIHPGQTVSHGAFGEFKWGGKYYEGEILGVSGEFIINHKSKNTVHIQV